VFHVRYELYLYMLRRINSVFKELNGIDDEGQTSGDFSEPVSAGTHTGKPLTRTRRLMQSQKLPTCWRIVRLNLRPNAKRETICRSSGEPFA
jgi:hypothetical protein